jgi:DNA-directed RNA polymerase specialized sigma24 family protein
LRQTATLPLQTAPDRTSAMPARPIRQPPDAVAAAFRELHGARLHGFALLVTLGDRSQAAGLASDALAAGVERLDELRHPERAAAWLRRRVVEGVHDRRSARHSANDRTLDDIGADEQVMSALGALSRMERAALVSSSIERLDRRDVAHVVGRDGTALDRLLRRARTRYVDAYPAQDAPTTGPIRTRIVEVAEQALT